MGRSTHQSGRDTDGGWAWIVMVAVFVGMLIYCSSLFMGGVFYTVLLHRYNEGAAKTSLIGSLSFGGLCLLGPVAGAFINKFSCRVSILVGGTLTTAGFVMSAFAPNLSWTIFTAGAVTGVGYAFSSAGLICALGFFFERWRDQMLAVAFILVGVAMFTSAPLATFLIETHGLSATFLVVASIQAQMCVVGMICKASDLEKEVHTRRKVDRKRTGTDKLSQYLDVTLLQNFSFLCFLLNTSAWNFALCAALVHLPNYVIVLGGNDRDINIIMTIFSVSNIIGRVLGLIAVSKLRMKSLVVNIIVLFLSGIITTAFPYYSSLPGGTFLFAVQLGVCVGIPNSMMTPLAVQFVGVTNMSEACGLSYLFCGFGVTSGPFIAGYIYGISGAYDNSFLASGVVLLIGGGFGVLSLCCGRSEEDKQSLEIRVDGGSKTATYQQDIEDKTELRPLADSHSYAE